MPLSPAARELVVLGTASQAPTRTRNHNGYLLRWDGEGFLFDPGEGTQRQLLLAGVPASRISRICITHAHGDHCLGLPGVLQRLVLDDVHRPVDLCYPLAAAPYIDALRRCSATSASPDVVDRPIDEDGPVVSGKDWTLSARALDHRIAAVGWRLQEHDGVRMLPDRLEAAGVSGAQVGALRDSGNARGLRGPVRLEDVSVPRSGQSFAFIMDTRLCPAAYELAEGVDLLVCESTYLHRDAALAQEHGHLTALQAAVLARDAGARNLVLTHFSRRYGPDSGPFLDEAAAVFPAVSVAEDLQRFAVPARR